MNLRAYHWLIAATCALLFHGVLAYAVFYTPKPTQGARGEGVGGLEISISMVASAIGAVPQEEVLPEPEPEIEPEKEEEAIEEALEEEVIENEVIEEPRPEPLPEPESVVELEPEEEIEPEAIEEVKPEPVVTPVPQPRVKVQPPQKPVIKPKSTPKPKPIVLKVPKATPVKEIEPAQQKQLARISEGVQQNANNANRADQISTQGGGRIVGQVKPDYMTTLRRWLEQHKTYPLQAKRRRQQGVVIIAFSVTREGNIPDFYIKKGSGYKHLDNETIAMLKRAQPLPQFPVDMEGDILKIALPIQFTLR